MEKVKLPKEVADAIENVRNHYKAGAEFDLELMRNETFEGTIVITRFTQESRYCMVQYFRALVNDYEVEQTPEDKVREYFEKAVNNKYPLPHIAVIDTLDILGIKIEGVNT